jgi:hypothetical protein
MKKKYVIQFYISLVLVLISIGHAFTQTASIEDGYKSTESMAPMSVDTGTAVVTETVFNEDGSIQFSTETIKLLNDATYRAGKYPSEYLLTQVPGLLENRDLSFALWTLMNVYKSDPEKVRTVAFKLADHGVDGSHYLNAFYTYVFTDPEIFAFPEGQEPFLQNPLRLEEKLESCQTLAVYSNQYLKMKSDAN